MDSSLVTQHNITPVDGSFYQIIDSSILQESVSSVSKCLSCHGEKILKLRYDKKERVNKLNSLITLCENIIFWFLLLQDFDL